MRLGETIGFRSLRETHPLGLQILALVNAIRNLRIRMNRWRFCRNAGDAGVNGRIGSALCFGWCGLSEAQGNSAKLRSPLAHAMMRS